MNACAPRRAISIGLRSERVIRCVLMAFEIVNRSSVVWHFLRRFVADMFGSERVTVLFSLPEDSKEFICSLSQKF